MRAILEKTKEKLTELESVFTDDVYEKYLYGEISYSSLPKILNSDRYAIDCFMSEKGLKRRKSVIDESTNHSLFSNIDGEKKAYLLGFYLADGSLQGEHINISISEEDSEIINMFKSAICKYNKVTIIKPCLNKKTGYVSKPMVSITFRSKQISEDLNRYGIGENKTYESDTNLSFIPNDLMIHFIRGYFDGDGTVCYTHGISKKKLSNGEYKEYPYNNYNWNIISNNEKIIRIISDFLKENFGIHSNIINDKRGHYLVEINRKKDFFYMRELLYKDATLFLTRKKEKYFSISQNDRG